ncbi:hypothetical protein F4604DRAFT_1940243 [Suillus subluteus]|nr:hypothetical protein F4604DRAFT_1940243 [Suillus subluteus]
MSAGSFSCTHPPLSAQCTQLTANANSEIAELTAVKSKHGPQEPPSPSPPPPPPPASPPPEEGLTGPTRPAWRVVYKPQRREKPAPKSFPAPTAVPAIEHLKPNLPTWAKWRLNPAHIPASMPAPFSPRPVMLAARLGLFDTSLGVNTPRSNETMPRDPRRSRSPEEKRGGVVFEDLNLGLDLRDEDEEYDKNDPNDQRRSRYLMRAKLDEIERTLAQFLRHIKTDDLDQHITITHA